MAYCIYTGASTIIQDVKSGDAVARHSMNTFLRALEGGCTTCPIVQRSINIIMNSLENTSVSTKATSNLQFDSVSNNNSGNAANLARNYPPAFPQYNWQTEALDQIGTSTLMDSDALFLLDCFPENHIDSGVNEWYMPS